MTQNPKIKIIKNGPYLVTGNIPLTKEISIVGPSGEPEEWQQGEKYPKKESYCLCRCGQSKDKPYCDGSHIKCNFDGSETANKKDYLEQADKISGPELDLTDSKELCVGARFCNLAGGTWKNVKKSDNPHSKEIAIKTACLCPSGRLVVWDKKSKKPIEPPFEPSIRLIEDPQKKVSGAIWLKGNIPLESADGTNYETRNRVTLCRCGQSKNKPYCDGSHLHAGFNDGDDSLR